MVSIAFLISCHNRKQQNEVLQMKSAELFLYIYFPMGENVKFSNSVVCSLLFVFYINNDMNLHCKKIKNQLRREIKYKPIHTLHNHGLKVHSLINIFLHSLFNKN